MLSDDVIEKYMKAGRIASCIKKRLRGIVKPGVKYVEIADFVEKTIIEMGGIPAFPCNISLASEAAHYTPFHGDHKTVPDYGVLKIDFGVCIDGYLSDTAVSIDLSGEHEDLIKAAEEALDKAIEVIKPGIKVSEIGEVIEKTIKSYGANPIRNLTGHNLERYRLHAGLSIPNTRVWGGGRIREGMAVAIEPFATKGIGYVVDSKTITIYSISKPLTKVHKLGVKEAEELYKIIYNERKELPFTERWYTRYMSIDKIRSTIEKMYKKKILTGYPVLVEASGGQVAQAEDSIIVLRGEIIVYTR